MKYILYSVLGPDVDPYMHCLVMISFTELTIPSPNTDYWRKIKK